MWGISHAKYNNAKNPNYASLAWSDGASSLHMMMLRAVCHDCQFRCKLKRAPNYYILLDHHYKRTYSTIDIRFVAEYVLALN